jgi:large subunit ribosomal protein L31
MKKGIHPTYYPNARVICSCGATWTTGSTVEEIRTDVCSTCHPFYTGEQRIVDTAGQVERFMKRLERRQSAAARRDFQQQVQEEADAAARKARARGDDPNAAAAEVMAKYETDEVVAEVEEVVEKED